MMHIPIRKVECQAGSTLTSAWRKRGHTRIFVSGFMMEVCNDDATHHSHCGDGSHVAGIGSIPQRGVGCAGAKPGPADNPHQDTYSYNSPTGSHIRPTSASGTDCAGGHDAGVAGYAGADGWGKNAGAADHDDYADSIIGDAVAKPHPYASLDTNAHGHTRACHDDGDGDRIAHGD